MSLGDTLAQFAQLLMQLTASLDPRTAAFLFILCGLGEFGMSIPYLLESVWLLVGYQLGGGVLSPLHLFGLWLAAQCGRQLGAMGLYNVTRVGTTPVARLYQKFRHSRFWPKVSLNKRVTRHINLTSPFTIAYGRLFGLRLPLTITLAVKKRPARLLAGVILSSIMWDGVYITVGATVGRTAAVNPVQMLIGSVGGLTLLYLVTFLVRRWLKRRQPASN